MPEKDEFGNWKDPRGKVVPPEHIPAMTKKREYTVERIVKDALNLEKKMVASKKKALAKILDYMAKLQDAKGVKANSKGNITLTSFDGSKQVELAMDDIITFNEEFPLAKAQIDLCLRKWATNANQALVAVVEQAFNVDKAGRVNKQAILKLRQIKVKDADWRKAMQLLVESIEIKGSRQYLNIRVRDNATAKFRTVKLNFSSM